MTEHKHGPDCGHEHDIEEFDTIILTDDDGNDHEFLHLDTLEVDGSTYFVLVPISGEEDEEVDEAIILKLGQDEDGNDMLMDIEDDEEWEKVADAWETMEEAGE